MYTQANRYKKHATDVATNNDHTTNLSTTSGPAKKKQKQYVATVTKERNSGMLDKSKVLSSFMYHVKNEIFEGITMPAGVLM